MITMNGFGGGALGKANAAAGTVYYAVVPGNPLGFTRVVGFQVNNGNTANDFTFLRPIGRAKVATAIAADVQATMVLDSDPSPTGNTIAAGDQVVYVADDGTYNRVQVNTSGWNGTTKTLTFTGNVTKAVAVGNSVFMFGVPADTDPVTGLAFPVYTPPVSAVTDVQLYGGGFRGTLKGDPLLIYNPNATAATILNRADYAYTSN